MKVYGVLLSPFVQKVLLAARLKGHELAVDALPGVSTQSPEFAAISPMRRVPVLADGDLHICESSAIIAHLDEVLDGPPLLPADAAGRATARAIAAIADGEFALRPFVTQKVFGGPSEPALLAAAEAQTERGLDAIERMLDPAGPWTAGAAASVADATLVPYLVLAEIIGRIPGVPDFVGTRPNLVRYRDTVLALPVPARTREEMTAGFARMMDTRRQQAAQAQQ